MDRLAPRALTIAGSDSGGGAGIQADLKTFTAFRVYGMSVITSVTAQNTVSVLGTHDLPASFVEAQIDAVLSDIGADAVKTGMLSNSRIVSSVVKKLKEYGVKSLVVDPVMRSKGGDTLLDEEAVQVVMQELLPITSVITPNIPEAEKMTGMRITSPGQMKEAARKLKSFGPSCVVIKGGHMADSNEALDIFYDGEEFREMRAHRMDTANTHGTGCTFSAAICAAMARGLSPVDAVKEAKDYVTFAIERSFSLGKGHGPLNHFWKFE